MKPYRFVFGFVSLVSSKNVQNVGKNTKDKTQKCHSSTFTNKYIKTKFKDLFDTWYTEVLKSPGVPRCILNWSRYQYYTSINLLYFFHWGCKRLFIRNLKWRHRGKPVIVLIEYPILSYKNYHWKYIYLTEN